MIIILLAACDPPLSSDLLAAVELQRARRSESVVLLPLGVDYKSIDAGLSVVSRYALAHLAVASHYSRATPVTIAPLECASLTTADALLFVFARARSSDASASFLVVVGRGSEGPYMGGRGTAASASPLMLHDIVGALASVGARSLLLGEADARHLSARVAASGAVLTLGDAMRGLPGPLLENAPSGPLEEDAGRLADHSPRSPPLDAPAAPAASWPAIDDGLAAAADRLRLDAARASRDASAPGAALSTAPSLPLAASPLLPPLVDSALSRYGFYGRGGAGRAAEVRRVGWYGSTPHLALARWEAEGDVAGAMGAASAAAASARGDAPHIRVGVLGGAFNPITTAHLCVAAEAVASGCVDEVWLVPCGARPDKPGLLVSALARTIMTALAVEEAFPANARVRVAPLELGEKTALSSCSLMTRLEEAFGPAPGPSASLSSTPPECSFSFRLIIGADLVASLPTWRDAERLRSRVRFLVVPRPGTDDGAADRGGEAAEAAATAANTTAPATAADADASTVGGASFDLVPLRWRSSARLRSVGLSSTDVRRRVADAAASLAAQPAGGILRRLGGDAWAGIEGLLPRAAVDFMAREGLYA